MPAWAVCVDEHAKAAALGGGLRDGAALVHVVRDPLEVCISAYQYALRSSESWLHVGKAELGGRSYQQYYRASSVETGLGKECRRSMKELRQMAELYQATRREGAVLTLRFEEIEAGFDDAPAHSDVMMVGMLSTGGAIGVPVFQLSVRGKPFASIMRITGVRKLL